MTLLLRKSEVADLLDMRQAIQLTERVFVEQGAGRVQPWAPFVVGHDDHELRVNAGSLSGLRLVGLRAGMGKAGSQFLLYQTAEEKLVSILAYPFSYLRVGATVGLSVDRMARQDARRLLVIGTGRIARVSLEAIACLRKFQEIQVYSRKPQNRMDFVSTAKTRLGIEVDAVADLEMAVRGADVIVIATSAEEPVLRGAWLAQNVHLSSAGIRHEIDYEAYLRAKLVVVSSREQEQSFRADWGTDNVLLRLTSGGHLDWVAIPELGEVVSGKITLPAGFTVFRESQGGFGDLILANWIYERAKTLGRGLTVDLNN